MAQVPSAGPAGSPSRDAEEDYRIHHMEEATRNWLLYFVVPVWLAAGLADYLHHRRSDIEHTAGTKESAIHLLMMTEAGVPAMLGLFRELNAGVLLSAVGAFVLHELTAYWDVSYAESQRTVTPGEQHVHSFLEVVPLMATAFMAVLHNDQARALLRIGGHRPRFGLRPKGQPLSRRYVRRLLGAIALCIAAPYTEELLRCWRTARRDGSVTA